MVLLPKIRIKLKITQLAIYSHYYAACQLVGAVRAINGLFGANCSKAIKFGPDVDRTLLDRFRVDAKKGIGLRHGRDEILNGRHYMSEISELSNIIIKIPNYTK